MIHFDFDDRYQDELIVGNAISRREGVVWSVVVHVVLMAALLYLPYAAVFQPTAEEIEQERLERLAELERLREEAPRFVYVEPLREVPVPPQQLRERLELSDLDRRSSAPDVAPEPQNPLPFSRGDTAERVESAEAESARGEANVPEPLSPEPPRPDEFLASAIPAPEGAARPDDERTAPRPGSVLGEAVRNLGQYVQGQRFENPRGSNLDRDAAIQFDTKGVEFGPWLRRFVNQVRRNWTVPLSAMSFRGRVVLQFNIHRDGRITDVHIARPSDIESFNRAAYNAIILSSPTEPLPPEYPDEKAFFTVTFFYNESPGS